MIVSKELLEMAKVYRMPTDRVIRYIYIPEIIAFIRGEKKKENLGKGKNNDN